VSHVRNGAHCICCRIPKFRKMGAQKAALLAEPIELMKRLAAQLPKPRVNLVLYAGVLPPHSKLRTCAVVHDPRRSHHRRRPRR
jgi:hypothetical protein